MMGKKLAFVDFKSPMYCPRCGERMRKRYCKSCEVYSASDHLHLICGVCGHELAMLMKDALPQFIPKVPELIEKDKIERYKIKLAKKKSEIHRLMTYTDGIDIELDKETRERKRLRRILLDLCNFANGRLGLGFNNENSATIDTVGDILKAEIKRLKWKLDYTTRALDNAKEELFYFAID